jgi:hypothetical protein
MELRGSYLERGRRFISLHDDNLDKEWASTFIAVCAEDNQSRRPDLNDLSAEIGLRGREEPAHLVKHVMPQVIATAERIMREEGTQHIEDRLGEFFIKWKGPNN